MKIELTRREIEALKRTCECAIYCDKVQTRNKARQNGASEDEASNLTETEYSIFVREIRQKLYKALKAMLTAERMLVFAQTRKDADADVVALTVEHLNDISKQ